MRAAQAIEAHDLMGVKQRLTENREYLHARVGLSAFGNLFKLGNTKQSRLAAYWRYAHSAAFNHWCTPLHWAVHISSKVRAGDRASKKAALSVIAYLLEVGAFPTVEDGWGHDVFGLSGVVHTATFLPACLLPVTPSRLVWGLSRHHY